MNRNEVIVAVAAVTALVIAVFLVMLFSVLRLWVQALLTHTPVGIRDLVRMRLRRVPARLVVHAAIALGQRGVRVSARDLEVCYLSHGVGRVSTAVQLATLYLETCGPAAGPPAG